MTKEEMFTDKYYEQKLDENGMFPDSDLGDALWVLLGGYSKHLIDGKLYWKKI